MFQKWQTRDIIQNLEITKEERDKLFCWLGLAASPLPTISSPTRCFFVSFFRLGEFNTWECAHTPESWETGERLTAVATAMQTRPPPSQQHPEYPPTLPQGNNYHQKWVRYSEYSSSSSRGGGWVGGNRQSAV
jgi:hypothetical protein